jgi:hypothetical protein
LGKIPEKAEEQTTMEQSSTLRSGLGAAATVGASTAGAGALLYKILTLTPLITVLGQVAAVAGTISPTISKFMKWYGQMNNMVGGRGGGVGGRGPGGPGGPEGPSDPLGRKPRGRPPGDSGNMAHDTSMGVSGISVPIQSGGGSGSVPDKRTDETEKHTESDSALTFSSSELIKQRELIELIKSTVESTSSYIASPEYITFSSLLENQESNKRMRPEKETLLQVDVSPDDEQEDPDELLAGVTDGVLLSGQALEVLLDRVGMLVETSINEAESDLNRQNNIKKKERLDAERRNKSSIKQLREVIANNKMTRSMKRALMTGVATNDGELGMAYRS